MKINRMNDDLSTNLHNRLKFMSVKTYFFVKIFLFFYFLEIFFLSIKEIFIIYLKADLRFIKQQVYI